MSARGGALLVGISCVLTLAAGCAPARSQYYSGLGRSRLESFRRWDTPTRTDRRPCVEGRLELEEAVRLALLYNPSLQAALQGKEMARGRVLSAYSEALPRVNLAGRYTRLDEVPTVDLGGGMTISTGELDNYSFQVTVTQPLFSGTMMVAQRAARLYAYLSDENVRAAVENVVASVARAYFDALLAERLVAVQEDALGSARAHLKAVELRRQEGVATEYDVLRARVEVSNIQAELIEQKRRRDIALTVLLRSMGVSQRSDVELMTPLSYDEQEPPTLREAVRVAFQNRPDIYQASIWVDLQEAARFEARSKWLPRLEATYSHIWSKPDRYGASRWGGQWQAGLGLMWTAFDGLAREGRIIQETALLRQREIQLEDAEQRALLEVKDALLELESARELVESQSLNLERAGRALELVKEGYDVGVNTEIEVLDARAALTRAKGLYYVALHRHTTARIALRRAMGLLCPEPGAAQVPQTMPSPAQIPVPEQDKPEEQASTAEEGPAGP